jgi:hypothetical protein
MPFLTFCGTLVSVGERTPNTGSMPSPEGCRRPAPERDTRMPLEFTVGINIAGKRQSVTVAAEDALVAALKVKHERPDAVINYVRRRNRRGDVRHPHEAIITDAE